MSIMWGTRRCGIYSMKRMYATALKSQELIGNKKPNVDGVGVGGRFWRNANVKPVNNGLTIQLDNKPIKTSDGNILVLPKNKSVIGQLIAQEWNVLTSIKLKPHSLPLTSLAARAVDLEKDTTTNTRSQIYNHVLPYFDTDTLLIFSPYYEHDGELRKTQELLYKRVIKWAQDSLQEYSKSDDVKITWADHNEGIIGNKQPIETVETVINWLDSLNSFELTAFERIVLTTKSFLVGFWLIQRSRGKPVCDLVQGDDDTTSSTIANQIATIVNLELDFQTRKWGHVEDTHDVDWADIRRQISSCFILLIDKV